MSFFHVVACATGRTGYDYHVDPVSGNDTTGDGSLAAPFATLSKALTAVGTAQDKRIGIKRGTTLRNDPATPSAGAHGLYIGAYGTGAVPNIFGSSQIAVSSFSKSGNLYTLTGHTFNPFTLALVNGSSATKLYMTANSGTNSAASPSVENEWTWFPASHATKPNTLEFFTAATITGYQLEVPQGGSARTGIAFVAGTDHLVIEDVSIRYWSGSGVTFDGNDCRCVRVDASYNGGDGKDANNQAKNVYIGYGSANYNGRRLSAGNGPGDGISYHSGGGLFSTGIVEFETLIGNTHTGVGNQAGCQVVTRYCYFEDNNYDYAVYNVADSIIGQHDLQYSVIVHKTRATPWFNSNSSAGSANEATAVNVRNVSIFYATGLTTTQVCNVQGFTNRFENIAFKAPATISNFGQLILNGATETKMTSVNNSINGPGTVWRSFASSNQPQTQTGLLTTDPLFTNTATYDLTLQAGSPCLDSGSDWGQTRDYVGNGMKNTPDRGAYERQ